MRYDTPIFFQRITKGKYEPNTGNYEPDTIVEDERMASVSSCSVETLKIVYGDLKQGALTIHLQNHYNKPFDEIRIGKKIYDVDYQKKLRVKHTFVVHEVQ